MGEVRIDGVEDCATLGARVLVDLETPSAEGDESTERAAAKVEQEDDVHPEGELTMTVKIPDSKGS